jgi:hypothetical protein
MISAMGFVVGRIRFDAVFGLFVVNEWPFVFIPRIV